MFAKKLGRVAMLFLPLSTLIAGIPLALGLVPRNAIYGIRTEHSLSSDAAWAAMNHRGGWALIIASVIAVALIAAVQRRMGSTPVSMLLQAGVFTANIALVVVLSLSFGA